MLKRIPFQYRITILYIVFGALWILFSDRLLIAFTDNPQRIQVISTYKGWFFILVTGTLLFYLIRNEIRRRALIFDQLLEAKKKADEVDRLKTTFLSNLSHYIRTPMNSILGFIELIEDKDTSPENHQLFLSYINESSQHLLQTITSIIEISKIQERLVQVGSQTLHLNDLVELLASTARVEISEKNKPVTVETKCPLPVGGDSVSADRDKILLILSNLVTNSVNFTTRGSIEIGYRLTGSEVHFWVMDTGPGIAAERQNSLFTDFLQNSENTRISGEGSGLSLVLSSRLAKLLGGYLWLDRTGPGGSTFCLNIPIHPNSREGSS